MTISTTYVVACIGFTEIGTRMDAIQYNTMYKLMDVTEFLLQYSFRNPIKFYYTWIVSLCIICNVIENV
jgi:hypothetical protein